jgi:hypothetical protein
MYQSGEKVMRPNERGWFVDPNSYPWLFKKKPFSNGPFVVRA